MTTKEPAIIRAERLRAVMAMPEYEVTIGAWVDEAYKSALHGLTTAKDPNEVYAAQGAYRSVSSLKEQFEQVFRAEQAVIERTKRKSA